MNPKQILTSQEYIPLFGRLRQLGLSFNEYSAATELFPLVAIVERATFDRYQEQLVHAATTESRAAALQSGDTSQSQVKPSECIREIQFLRDQSASSIVDAILQKEITQRQMGIERELYDAETWRTLMDEIPNLGTLERKLSESANALITLNDATSGVFEEEILLTVSIIQRTERILNQMILFDLNVTSGMSRELLTSSLQIDDAKIERYVTSSDVRENLYRIGLSSVLLARNLESDIRLRISFS